MDIDTSHHIKTILIIEDDRFIGEMYVRSLRNNGYTVDWAVTGKEGFQAAASHQYDLIMLDIMLPEVQGGTVLQKLRGGPQDLIPRSRVIILTNFDQDDATKAELQKQADAYLIKADITPRKLIDIVAQMRAVGPLSNL